MSDELHLRQALLEDIPVLARHRRNMTQAIACERDFALDPAGGDIGEATYASYLREHFAAGTAVAWAIESSKEIVASGVVSVLAWPPAWGDCKVSDGRIGMLHSVWTEPSFRRRGCARRIVQAAIDWCRACNLRRLDLGASAAGRPLYEQMGFKPAATMMHLLLR